MTTTHDQPATSAQPHDHGSWFSRLLERAHLAHAIENAGHLVHEIANPFHVEQPHGFSPSVTVPPLNSPPARAPGAPPSAAPTVVLRGPQPAVPTPIAPSNAPPSAHAPGLLERAAEHPLAHHAGHWAEGAARWLGVGMAGHEVYSGIRDHNVAEVTHGALGLAAATRHPIASLVGSIGQATLDARHRAVDPLLDRALGPDPGGGPGLHGHDSRSIAAQTWDMLLPAQSMVRRAAHGGPTVHEPEHAPTRAMDAGAEADATAEQRPCP